MIEHQRSAFDHDDDAPHHDFCPTSNPEADVAHQISIDPVTPSSGFVQSIQLNQGP